MSGLISTEIIANNIEDKTMFVLTPATQITKIMLRATYFIKFLEGRKIKIKYNLREALQEFDRLLTFTMSLNYSDLGCYIKRQQQNIANSDKLTVYLRTFYFNIDSIHSNIFFSPLKYYIEEYLTEYLNLCNFMNVKVEVETEGKIEITAKIFTSTAVVNLNNGPRNVYYKVPTDATPIDSRHSEI